MPRARLNYEIPVDLHERLEVYCLNTDRKAAEVVRQLIGDYLESEEPVERQAEHQSGRRADVWVTSATAEAFEQRVRAEDHVTRSALLTKLLTDYVNDRGGEPLVLLTIKLTKIAYDKLAALGKPALIAAQLVENNIEQKEESTCQG